MVAKVSTRSPVLRPAYRYTMKITAVYDADTIKGDIDLFDSFWKHNEIIRLYGINAQEIRRSKAKGIGDAEVAQGYDQRDYLLTLLGVDPAAIPRKVAYHTLPRPVWVVIETIKDESGKFGRLLGIIHRAGENLNEEMRDRIGGVEFYDGQTWPADTPIVPPG